ncbi:MAG TPA: lysylphosphatidylglycerol synthase domain-containing protein [Solirubrobacterales bacterium]|nr:lysylphosphatidylglycerol synthase domain-containing protein [Solirubrobacterales bacterium]
MRMLMPLRVSRPTPTTALFLGGIVLLAVLIWRVGPVSIGHVLLAVGWTAILVPAPHVLQAVGETSGWWLAFSRGSCPVSFATLLRVNIAVKVVQGVTPSVSQATELVRIHLLRQAGVPADLATASVVMAKTTASAGELVFVVLGVGTLAGSMAIDRASVIGAGVGIGILALVLVGLLAWQRVGLFRPLAWLGMRLGLVRGFLERHGALLASTETLLQDYLVEQRARFLASGVAYLVSWLLSVVETWVFLWMLGLQTTIVDALLIQAWLALVVRLTAFVPSNIGTLEGGVLMVFAIVGLSPQAALALALLRRVRQLVWMTAALAVLPRARRPSSTDPAAEPAGRSLR